MSRPSLDAEDLPCACLRTGRNREILYVNDFFVEHYGWARDAVMGAAVATLFSRASQVFCDSYVYPKALAEPVCAEIQLTLVTPAKVRRPVIASVRRLANGDFAWVLLEADNRQRLFDELTAAREALQAHSAELKALSRTDALTEVLNRRGADEGMRAAFREADLTASPVAVLLMDIDNFKGLNDREGHQAGDIALKALGRLLKTVCRASDVVGRFGGDEFVCVLAQTNADGARKLCARIHTAVAADPGLSGLTVSIGAAVRPGGHALKWADVLSEADRALYSAKAAGRNTTVIRDAGIGGLNDKSTDKIRTFRT